MNNLIKDKGLRKISTRPFFFGIEKEIVSKYDFFFGDHAFYVVDQGIIKASYKLQDMIELKRTTYKLNNRYIWQITLRSEHEQEKSYRFAPNHSLWNRNFTAFYKKIKAIKPEVLKSAWSFWGL